MAEHVLEIGLVCEVLKERVVSPAIVHTRSGESADVLQQRDPDHEACFAAGPPIDRAIVRSLIFDPVQVDLLSQADRFVLHTDDSGSRLVSQILEAG